jgi:hypothetical protein
MAKNRPRQNMSLGPNNGGFGSGGSNASTPASGGNGNGGNGNGGNGNGGNNNNNNNRPRNRNDNPFQGGGSDTGVGISADGVTLNGQPFTPPPAIGGEGSGSIFDDPQASKVSGADGTYKSTAWGLLNQAGIDNDPVFGQQQTAWLNDHIDQLWQRWKGEAQLTGEDRPDFDNWLLNQFGGAPPGTTPDRAFVTNQWGPAFQQYAGRMYQSLSPRARGTDMRQWQAPRRVIQF